MKVSKRMLDRIKKRVDQEVSDLMFLKNYIGLPEFDQKAPIFSANPQYPLKVDGVKGGKVLPHDGNFNLRLDCVLTYDVHVKYKGEQSLREFAAHMDQMYRRKTNKWTRERTRLQIARDAYTIAAILAGDPKMRRVHELLIRYGNSAGVKDGNAPHYPDVTIDGKSALEKAVDGDIGYGEYGSPAKRLLLVGAVNTHEAVSSSIFNHPIHNYDVIKAVVDSREDVVPVKVNADITIMYDAI